jgi:predicted GNAT family acetyltransferase
MPEALTDSPEITADRLDIEHHPEKHRFEVKIGSGRAELVYRKAGEVLIFHHTGVPEAYEGRGIGGALVKAGLDYVREHGLRAVALCPFVKAYIEKNPEYKTLIRSRS